MTVNLQTIISVINTLNGVEVKGRNNMNKLLGAIMTLEQIVREAQEAAPAQETDEPEESKAD